MLWLKLFITPLMSNGGVNLGEFISDRHICNNQKPSI